MTAEENKRMLALACTVADMKTENMYLAQRVQELVDEYNNVAHQLIGKKNRKNKDSSKQTIDEMRQMEEQCEHLERENRELKRFEKAMHEFVKDKNIYMRKDSECPFRPGCVSVGSFRCLECGSCLGVIEGLGVICANKLVEARVSFPNNDLQRTL